MKILLGDFNHMPQLGNEKQMEGMMCGPPGVRAWDYGLRLAAVLCY